MAFHRITTTCTAFFALAAPSLADITAAEVIADWYDTARKMQQELTVSSTEQVGDVTTLHGYALTQEFPDGSVTVAIDRLRFRDVGDGTVEITGSRVTTMNITLNMEYEDDLIIPVEAISDGAMLVSGTPQEMTYTAGPDDVELRFDLSNYDESAETGVFTVLVSGATFAFTQSIMPDDYLGIIGQFSVAAIALNAEASGYDDPSIFHMTALMKDLGLTFDMVQAPMPADGVQRPGDSTGQSMITIGESELHAWGEGVPEGDISITARMDGATTGSVTTSDSIEFDQVVNGFLVSASGPDFPVETVEYTVEQIASSGNIPIGAQGKLQDFAFALSFNGMTVNEAMWALFDPDQTIPRDPMNFDLGLSGKIKIFIDIFDPESKIDSFSQTGQPFLEIYELNLDRFSVDIAGAFLTGFGALGFPETREYGPYHLPDPVGKVTFAVQGAQQLIVSMGALPSVPAELTFGAMSMIGMFSKPTGEVDSYETVIEFDAGYGITINGMKIQ